MSTLPSTARPPVWRRPARVVLALWAPALVTVVGATMVAHWAPLPAPRPDEALARSLLELRDADERGWTAFHVLYADCPCSQRLVDHLCASARPPEVAEVVLLVGEHEATSAALARAGFRVVPTTARELHERHHIESAPLFVVTDPKGAVRYSGGHTNRKQGLDHADLDALAALLEGRSVDALPVYGCGVSNALQTELDPLGLKY